MFVVRDDYGEEVYGRWEGCEHAGSWIREEC